MLESFIGTYYLYFQEDDSRYLYHIFPLPFTSNMLLQIHFHQKNRNYKEIVMFLRVHFQSICITKAKNVKRVIYYSSQPIS